MEVIIKKISKDEIKNMGVSNWSIWEKEVSEFPWEYDSVEDCYILEGEVTVEAYGKSYDIKPGDFVTFPKGMECYWKVTKPIRKHYNFR